MIDYSFLPEPIAGDLQSWASQSKIKQGALSKKTYQNALFIGGHSSKCGIFDENNSLIENSDLHEYWVRPKTVSETEFSIDDSRVLYVGYFINVYGHLFTDGIKKLWFLKTDEGKKLIESGIKMVYMANWESMPDYAVELFEVFGFDATKFIQIKNPTKFKEVIIPDNSLETTEKEGRFVYNEFIDMFKKIKLRESNFQKYDKIYFTRTQLKNKKDYGEKSIEKLFKKKGFEIIAPEKLSVSNQIFLLQNCKEFATTYGTLSHEIVFMSEKSKAIIVIKSDYVNNYQIAIDQIKPMSITYVSAHKTNKNIIAHLGPFYLCPTKALKKYLGLKTFVIPYFFRPSFFCYEFDIKKSCLKKFAKKILKR